MDQNHKKRAGSKLLAVALSLAMAIPGLSPLRVLAEGSADAVPGMTITDQSENKPLSLSLEEGVITASQSSTKGYQQNNGSQGSASYLLLEEPVSGNFTMETTVSITEQLNTSSGAGLYVGAFSDTESLSEFASIGLRGNSELRGYGSKQSGFGAVGDPNILFENDQDYTITFSRDGDSFKISVSSGDEDIITYKSFTFYTGGELASGKPLFPGFSFLGVSAVISDIKITDTQSGTILLNSGDWSEGQVPALSRPIVKALTGRDHSMKVSWPPVADAGSYTVLYKAEGEDDFSEADVSALSFDDRENEYYLLIPNLTPGTIYHFEVTAHADSLPPSSAGFCTALLRDFEEREWQFAYFGTSTNAATNKYSGNIYDGLNLQSINEKGKFTADGYDGMAFYYTKVDPSTENFELEATFTVDRWSLTNGQEGFALMARDSIGTHGVASQKFPTNSVAAMATKVDYLNDEGDPVTLRIGLGARVVTGVTGTPENADATNFKNTMTPLDTTIQTPGEGRLIQEGGTYTLILKKTNTGYHMIYRNQDGVETEEIFYDAHELEQIDQDYIYVGFAAARQCIVSIHDISFTTSDPATDEPGEERPATLVEPSYSITSPKNSGSSAYELVYTGNADGLLTIKDQNGAPVISERQTSAGEKVKQQVTLTKGNNVFTVSFTPDPDFDPGRYHIFTNYDPAEFSVTIHHTNYGTADQTIVAAPNGSPSGTGSHAKPLDIKTALSYVQPGQTILLKAGTYQIPDGLKIPRGINGTPEQKIYLVSDPDSEERAVIDFMGTGSGFEIWGNYWYIRGIDVCNSKNMSKGIMVAGSYNTLDLIETYNNGNTGLQISGTGAETIESWPSYNLILNCTSYNNSDLGRTDADGFAAKITVGPGNVFRGCISHHNADDGWDFFAKIASGSIGAVKIEDCVSYHNGFLLDGTVGSTGNGFKMGGSALPGDHVLRNSITFDNKGKGIDSNSCPDINVYNSTSFNNKSYNVALYSDSDKNTNFVADGILSYKTEAGIGEQLKPNQTQPLQSTTNYFFNGTGSLNSEDDMVSEDWFVSLDTSVAPIRKADGSIDMQGLLELTDAAPADSGARLNPVSSPVLVIPAAIHDIDVPGHIVPAVRSKTKGSSNNTDASNQSYPASNGDTSVWRKDTIGWWLENQNGSYAKNEWKQVNGKWYFFDAQGYMVSGWRILDRNQWYFMDESGAMKTGWVLYKNAWYYLNGNGSMNTAPITENGKIYTFNSNGDCVNP